MSDAYVRSVQRYLTEMVTSGRRIGKDLPKGESYVLFAASPKAATATQDLFDTVGQAREAFIAAWKEYSKGKLSHILYIGEAPHVDHDWVKAKYLLHAQLVLSDKEIKP